MRNRWKIKGTFRTIAPLHVGSGGITHRTNLLDKENKQCDVSEVVVDYKDRPCIPGSTIKGVLRAWGEKFLAQEKDLQALERIFGKTDITSDKASAGWAIFQTAFARKPSDLTPFENHVPYWCKSRLTGVMSHVCINRDTGAPQHNKLFYEEFVPEGIVFDVEIDISRLEEGDVSLLLGILQKGSQHETHPWQLGASGANGWGRIEWALKQLQTLRPSLQFQDQKVGFDFCDENTTLDDPSFEKLEFQQLPCITLGFRMKCAEAFLVNDNSRAIKEVTDSNSRSESASVLPLRKVDGSAWLPTSSFRGALRSRAEFILSSLDASATGDPNQAAGDGPIERLFGATSTSARISVNRIQEVVSESTRELAPTRRQDFVAIDRFSGGAAAHAKFDSLYVDKPAFDCQFVINTSGLQPQDLALLRRAMEDVFQGEVLIGWGRSKGYGRFSLEGDLSCKKNEDPIEIPDSLFSKELSNDASTWISTQLSALRNEGAVAKPVGLNIGVLKGIQTRAGYVYHLKFIPEGVRDDLTLSEGEIPKEFQGPVTTQIEFDWKNETVVNIRRYEKDTEGQAVAKNDLVQEPVADRKLPAVPVKPGQFANPYYFLRLEKRHDFEGDLGDKKYASLRRYDPNLYSGKLCVRMTAKTPLIICDQPVNADLDHKTYPLRKDESGLPNIAASSVRGMIRAAYEGVTNSRFGVFPFDEMSELDKQANFRRFGYRMMPKEGLGLVPIRIDLATDAAELLMGTNENLPKLKQGNWDVGGEMYAAWVPQFERNQGRDPNGVTLEEQQLKHGDQAFCWLEKMRRTERPEFDFWRVRRAASNEADLGGRPEPSSKTSKYSSLEEFKVAKGYFVISNQNIKNKHDERFFFSKVNTEIPHLPPDVLRNYFQLLADCRNIHASEFQARTTERPRPTEYLDADTPAMSRHSYADPPTREILCYASVGENFEVEALYPVIIARKLFDCSPLDCLPDSLRPASSASFLSPADRLFGWVDQTKGAAEAEISAIRSHVQFSSVACLTDAGSAIERKNITLAILGQPKPQQGKFYLGDESGHRHEVGKTNAAAGYTEQNRIRGPKIYPHHALGVNEINEGAAESSQNRTITETVRPGTEFEFEIAYTNASALELGALLWILSLPRDHFLKLGLGKPLGYGSVDVQLDNSCSVVAKGDAWIQALANWGQIPESKDLVPLVNEFKHAIDLVNPDLRPAFLRSATGFGDLPIHYPRLPTQGPADGKHFEWFVKNEKGQKHSLPELCDADVSLPQSP